MKYNLCIDIGNTNIKSGLFIDDTLEELTFGIDQLQVITKKYNFDCIISNVRKGLPEELIPITDLAEKKVHLSSKIKLPVKILYKTPDTLGMDRVAAAIGAKKYFPDQNCIIIDAGTCITCDFIDKNNNFLGGNISPGINMRINAMHHFTDALPMVEIKENNELLGGSTEEALQNGALKGTIWEISSFIKEISKKYGKSQLVFTGGDTKYFVNYFKSIIFADSNLVLVGLNEILKRL
jgi:type III pantothenate kinase